MQPKKIFGLVWCLFVAMPLAKTFAQDAPTPAAKELSKAQWRIDYERLMRDCKTPPPPSSGPSLETRFPELKTFKPTQFWISHTALGNGGSSASSFSLDLKDDQFKGEGYVGTTSEPAAIAQDDVIAFARAIVALGIDEGTYKPRICGTDYYPSLEITLENSGQRLRIRTESQDLAPWVIEFGNNKFIAETDEIGKALKPIERQLNWRGLEDRWRESTPRAALLRKIREIMRARQVNP